MYGTKEIELMTSIEKDDIINQICNLIIDDAKQSDFTTDEIDDQDIYDDYFWGMPRENLEIQGLIRPLILANRQEFNCRLPKTTLGCSVLNDHGWNDIDDEIYEKISYIARAIYMKQ